MSRKIMGVTVGTTMNPKKISSGGNAIIDVVELPTEDINENAFYRLLTGTFVYNQYTQNNYTVHCTSDHQALDSRGWGTVP